MKNPLILIGTIALLFTSPVFAWGAHNLLTYAALKPMPEVSQDPIIPVETLESFLTCEEEGLVALFKTIDDWPNTVEAADDGILEGVKRQLAQYPSIPARLVFQGSADTSRTLVQQFIDRTRLNPDAPSYQTLFVEYVPGVTHRVVNPLQPQEVVGAAVLPMTLLPNPPFEKLYPGQTVSALEIITSAVDEPDFGMDIGLWEDSGTPYGKIYGLGKQPFGNKTILCSTQAPFHMGFYYESNALLYLISKTGNDLYRSYPEFRVHYYKVLSHYAFKTGHPYWGYRFLGWALHYVQDLSQPYHTSSLMTVESVLKNLLHGNSQAMVQLLSNRHLALENYQYQLMKAEFENNASNSVFIQRLGDQTHDYNVLPYDDLYPREVVAAVANHMANEVDEYLVNAFPSRYVSDPSYIFGITEPRINLYRRVSQEDPQVKSFNAELLELLEKVGVYTRVVVREGLTEAN